MRNLILTFAILIGFSGLAFAQFVDEPMVDHYKYRYDEGTSLWVLKDQAVIDALEAEETDIQAGQEAERLMAIELDDYAAKEAKKQAGLDQKVIDKLTEKEK